MWNFGLSLQFWLWLQTLYLLCIGRKAGGELRHWMPSHFEHSAQLLICSHERQGVALWHSKYEPVRATWLWGVAGFKDPLFIRSNVAVSIATSFSGYQVLFVLTLTLPFPLFLFIPIPGRGHGLIFPEIFWKWCTAEGVMTAES